MLFGILLRYIVWVTNVTQSFIILTGKVLLVN